QRRERRGLCDRAARSIHGASRKRRKRRLIILDEDRAVLQQCTPVAPLSAADKLASVSDELALARCLEARTHAGRSSALARRGESRDDTQARESVEQN